MKYDIVLAIPSYDGKWPGKTFDSIESNVRHLSSLGLKVGRMCRDGDANLARARHVLAESAMELAPYMCFIDADQVFKSDAIATLLDTAKRTTAPVVGGLYFRRKPPFTSTAGIGGRDIMDWPKDGVLEVDYTGTGMMLIETAVFKRIKKPYFLFPWDAKEEKFSMGEDVYFCQKVKNEGLRVLVDCGVIVGHLGEYVYAEGDYHWYKEVHAKIEAERAKESEAKPLIEVIKQ